jgi:succinate-acetate transporter protein
MADKANPAALGLVGFGLTTVLLSAVNAGLLPAHGEAVVLPLALAFGGTAQVIAGIMEFQTGNTFGTTAFIAYGAFWWWFASLVFLGGNKMLDLSGADSAIGFALVLWGVFTLGLWVSTFHLTRVLFCIFLTLWITFFLLGFGAMLGNPMLHQLGGWVGLLCGATAMYGSFAIVTNTTVGREIIPVGSRK